MICPIPKDSSTVKIPETVSIVARLRAQPTNRILVQNRPIERPVEKKPLAICVKPLHYDYNRVGIFSKISYFPLYNLLSRS